MRHYVPSKKNSDWLPHNVYMQMFYLIRDYYEAPQIDKGGERSRQHKAVRKAAEFMEEEYKKRPTVYGMLNPLRAFFEYPYFSIMFAPKDSQMGAGKRLWNLYRCRLARLTANELKLY